MEAGRASAKRPSPPPLQLNQTSLHITDKESALTDEEDIDHVLIGMPTSSEDYHPTVAIHG
jgi:flavorubredoxin